MQDIAESRIVGKKRTSLSTTHSSRVLDAFGKARRIPVQRRHSGDITLRVAPRRNQPKNVDLDFR